MNQPAPTVLKPREILSTLRKHALLWVVPTLAIGLIALVYALLKPPSWEAQLPLLVRDEAVGDVKRQGRFDNLDAMRTAQNTILEIVRSHSVVTAALTDVGPAVSATVPAGWPTADDVERCQKKITIKPPKGAEFGSTEVFYLAVRASSRDRALRLADAFYHQLEQHLQALRRTKAQTIFSELENAVALAEADVAKATAKLANVETEVGSDLSELRNLNDAATGGGQLRNNLALINIDLRSARSLYRSNQRLEEHLKVAQQDANQLVAMPTDLLRSQPALSRLKDGLIDAQLLTAQRMGKMSRLHPSVQEAMEAEDEIRRHLHRELEVAVRGLQAELVMNQTSISDLEKQESEFETKLEHLAALRARYDNLVSEVRRRSQILEQAQNDLANARASQAAVQAASLITRWAEPTAAVRPIGPGVLVIALSGLAGGLVIGLGCVFLTSPLEQLTGRRWSDHIFGRRQSDPQGEQYEDPHGGQLSASGRRVSDALAPSPTDDVCVAEIRAAELTDESNSQRPERLPSHAEVSSRGRDQWLPFNDLCTAGSTTLDTTEYRDPPQEQVVISEEVEGTAVADIPAAVESLEAAPVQLEDRPALTDQWRMPGIVEPGQTYGHNWSGQSYPEPAR